MTFLHYSSREVIGSMNYLESGGIDYHSHTMKKKPMG